MQRFSLKNGMHVVSVPVKGTDTVSVLVLVRIGSRYEYKKINGACHFIEHMMFKGTKRRPTAQHISRTLDAIGADFNAFTGKNYTGYYVKVDKSHLELGLDILNDMIFHSKFDEEEMNRERGAIIEEINMYEDNPMMHVDDLLEQVMFKGSTLGWEIAGSQTNIREMNHQEMVAFYQRAYQPSNMVLVVAGNLAGGVEKMIEKTFGTRSSSHDSLEVFEPFSALAPSKIPHVALQKKQTEQVQLAIGFPSFGLCDSRNFALTLLRVILGGNMSSRLFVEVRERRGLAYFVNVSNNPFEEVGNFMIRAGLDKKRLKEAIKTILKEIRKIQQEHVTGKELRDAKAFIRGQFAIRLEDSYQRAQWYANERMFHGRMRSPEAFLKKIDAVTVKDILDVAKIVFNEKQMSIAAVGPFADEKDVLHQSGFKTS